MPKRPKKKRDLNAGRIRPSKEPVWGGPEGEGVSQSMLSRYLCCGERFRIYTIDGLMPVRDFDVSIEFGNMWHECEEAFSAEEYTGTINTTNSAPWIKKLQNYTRGLVGKYRNQQDEINKWYRVCKLTFPIYMKYWYEHEDVKKKEPMLQEEVFKVPYELPSGRVVLLRGKWDAVDYIGGEGIFLQENKTKSQVDVHSLERQLTNDLQVMTYLVALVNYLKEDVRSGVWQKPVMGVRYNVIRRPLGGGKGSIRRHKATKNKPEETLDEYYDRLEGIIQEDQTHYFRRWKVNISQTDLERYEQQTLIPILENLCDDYEWWEFCKGCGPENGRGQPVDPFVYDLRAANFPDHQKRHFILPYGIYNVVGRGGFTKMDDYLIHGSTIGVAKVDTFFPELE